MKTQIKLRSGKYLDLENPQPDQFDLEDIAHALAKNCRFVGQSRHFCPISAHALRVADVVWQRTDNPHITLQALHHDSPEAFIHDVTKPFKSLLNDYPKYEKLHWECVCEKFNINPLMHHEVIKADEEIFQIEIREFWKDKPDISRTNDIYTIRTAIENYAIDFIEFHNFMMDRL